MCNLNREMKDFILWKVGSELELSSVRSVFRLFLQVAHVQS